MPGWQAHAQALADSGRFDEACRVARAALEQCRTAERTQAEQAARDWAAQHDAAALRRERERQEEAAAASRHAGAVQADMRAALLRIEQMGRRIGAEHELREVLARIDDGVAELLPAPRRATWLLDEGRDELRLAAGTDGGRAQRRARVSLQAPWSAVARCARLGRELVVSGPEPFADDPRATGEHTTMLWPLKAESRLVGVLVVGVAGRVVLDARQRSVFASFCAFAAVALANARTWSALSRSRARLAASERVARRARRDAAQLAARQAAAMQRLSALLGTPVSRLGAALGELDTAAPAGLPLDQALARHAEAAATACEALDLTRLEAGGVVLVPEVFAIDELVADAVAAFRQRRPGVPVQCTPGGAEVCVRADIAAIDRTLATLLEALAERAAPGEPLRLQVAADATRVRVHLALPAGTALRPPPGELLRLRLAVARELLALHGQPLRTLQRGGLAYTLALERVR